jgi:hypothetical protein
MDIAAAGENGFASAWHHRASAKRRCSARLALVNALLHGASQTK